jgi:hypothetical protein
MSAMKKFLDVLSILFLIVPFVCVVSAINSDIMNATLFGVLPWQLEILIVDIIPIFFGFFWILFRYGNNIGNNYRSKLNILIYLTIILMFMLMMIKIFRR